MMGHAGTAEMQGSLDFTYTHGVTILQQNPVDIPILATKLIFELSLIIRTQEISTLPIMKRENGFIIPTLRTP